MGGPPCFLKDGRRESKPRCSSTLPQEISMPKRFVASCCLVLSSLLGLGATLSAQTSQWEQLPSTPDLPKPDGSGIAAVNGIKIWYAVFGQGSPVIMVHG